MRLFILFIFLWSSHFMYAQPQSIYDWQSLQCHRSGYTVTASENYIIYNTRTGLLFIDKNDPEDIETMTTIDGLSGTNIQQIAYNDNANILFVIYTNGSIDILDENREVTTIRDIQNNNTLVTDKTVFDIVSYGRYIYLCMGVGLIEFDAVERIFTNTIPVDGGVKSMSCLDDRIYIANNQKLYYIDRNASTNINYIGNWTSVPKPIGGNSANFIGLATYKNSIFTSFNNVLYRLSSADLFTRVDSLAEVTSVSYIRSGDNYLYVGGLCNSAQSPRPNCLKNVVVFNAELTRVSYNDYYVNDNTGLVEEGHMVWLADTYHGIRWVDVSNGGAGVINLDDEYPWSNKVLDLLKTPDALYVATGGYSNFYQGLFNKEGLYKYADQSWKIYNIFTDAFFGDHQISDVSCLAYNPDTKEVAAGSYFNGLIIFNENGQKSLYNTENSALRELPGDAASPRVGALAYDKSGNLWVGNVLSPTPVVVFTPDKKSYAFANSQNATTLIRLTIDPHLQYKWFIDASRGVVVYDSGNDIQNSADDRWKVIPVYSTFENQNLPARCIYSDRNGRIWIGTQSGVFTLDCGSSVFDPNFDCTVRFPIIQDEALPLPFLNGQVINDIAEDGAGRKWFATNNGVFVTNDVADKLLLTLRTDNSPLAESNVLTIDIEKATGNVYIGTTAGVQVYKTDATEGNPYHNTQLAVFPNPVRPDYNGPIIIQGLAYDSSVKISDINGNLVYETKSQGSQAIWYGKDLHGNTVGSGVYYIWGVTTHNLENPVGIIGKVIFIN